MFAGEGGEWGCVGRAWAQANQTRRVALILLEHTETDKATHCNHRNQHEHAPLQQRHISRTLSGGMHAKLT